MGERDEQDAPRRLFREAPGRGPTADAKVRWEVVAMDIAAVVELSGGGGRLEALRVVTARGNKSAGRIHPMVGAKERGDSLIHSTVSPADRVVRSTTTSASVWAL